MPKLILLNYKIKIEINKLTELTSLIARKNFYRTQH